MDNFIYCLRNNTLNINTKRRASGHRVANKKYMDKMNFGQATEQAKMGFKITREGWNGKGMYVYFVPANSYPAVTEIAKAEFGETVPYTAYFAMKNATGTVNPWTITNTDVLAEDWMTVPPSAN